MAGVAQESFLGKARYEPGLDEGGQFGKGGVRGKLLEQRPRDSDEYGPQNEHSRPNRKRCVCLPSSGNCGRLSGVEPDHGGT